MTFDTFDDTEVLDIFTFWILRLLVEVVLHDVELLIVTFFKYFLKPLPNSVLIMKVWDLLHGEDM